MAKQKYIRNGIVFDPNIEEDIFSETDESIIAKALYRKGKKKKEKYFGI